MTLVIFFWTLATSLTAFLALATKTLLTTALATFLALAANLVFGAVFLASLAVTTMALALLTIDLTFLPTMDLAFLRDFKAVLPSLAAVDFIVLMRATVFGVSH